MRQKQHLLTSKRKLPSSIVSQCQGFPDLEANAIVCHCLFRFLVNQHSLCYSIFFETSSLSININFCSDLSSSILGDPNVILSVGYYRVQLYLLAYRNFHNLSEAINSH